MRTIFIALSLLLTATPAMAQVRIVPDQPESAASAANGVDVFVMNEGAQTVTTDLPTRLKVTGQDGIAMTLYRVGDAQATVEQHGVGGDRAARGGEHDVGGTALISHVDRTARLRRVEKKDDY